MERLPPAAADAPPAASRRGRGPLAALLAAESLPRDPEVPPRRRRDDWLRILFELEPLPLDPPAPPRRRRPWLRWLLAPDRLDHP